MVLFVGNLNILARKKDLLKLFGQFGNVLAAEIIWDKLTHRSRGFAFVHMEELNDAYKAINTLHNVPFMNQQLVVTDKGPRHAVRAAMTPPKTKKSK